MCLDPCNGSQADLQAGNLRKDSIPEKYAVTPDRALITHTSSRLAMPANDSFVGPAIKLTSSSGERARNARPEANGRQEVNGIEWTDAESEVMDWS